MRNIIPLVSILKVVSSGSGQTPQTPACAGSGASDLTRPGSDAFAKYVERNSLCTSDKKCWPQHLTLHRRKMKWNAVPILQSQYHPLPNSNYVITCVWRKGWFGQNSYLLDYSRLLCATLRPYSTLLKANRELNLIKNPHGRPWLQTVLWSRISRI